MAERGSDKHSPRIDEALEHDVRSMLQGSPVESRSNEEREQEGPGDDDPSPDARLSGDRGLSDDDKALRDDEVEARSELARHLAGSVFPASRKELITHAQETNAPPQIIVQLSQLPEDTYTHTEAVWVALGGRTEPRRA